jgi:hypothetical protein
MFRCLPVVNDEGLRSYKAIAFIKSKSNPERLIIKPKSNLILGAFLQNFVLLRQKTLKFSAKIQVNNYG